MKRLAKRALLIIVTLSIIVVPLYYSDFEKMDENSPSVLLFLAYFFALPYLFRALLVFSKLITLEPEVEKKTEDESIEDVHNQNRLISNLDKEVEAHRETNFRGEWIVNNVTNNVVSLSGISGSAKPKKRKRASRYISNSVKASGSKKRRIHSQSK